MYQSRISLVTAAAMLLIACAGTAAGGSPAPYPLSDGEWVIGKPAAVRSAYEDTLIDIAHRHGLGYNDIVRANPAVDPWLPGEGTEVILPTQFVLPQSRRDGLVINVAEYRMYHYTSGPEGQRVQTFPISIGRQDWGTPLGRASIVAKVRNPSWYPPDSVRKEYAEEGRELPVVVPPGPANPLGRYAMRLSIPGYLIHGTNRPAGVGMRVTHGCIRMLPEDIEWLFPRVPVDTPVQIVNQPYKFGWLGDELYLEVHPPLEEDGELLDRDMTAITELYVRATEGRPAAMDWAAVDQAWAERRGIPVKVGRIVPGGVAEEETVAVQDAGESG